MADTVVITTPDIPIVVLQPTLTDAIAAAQSYYIQSGVSASSAAASAAAAATSAAISVEAAGQASTAAAAAVTAIAGQLLAAVNKGSSILATRARLQRALRVDGALQTVNDYVMNNYNLVDDVALEWSGALYYPVGGIVYNMVKAAIPYSDTQAITLWQAAYNLP